MAAAHWRVHCSLAQPPMRPIAAEDEAHAVAIGALRMARRLYGRRGEVAQLRHDRMSEMWEAYIGVRRGGGHSGRSIWLHASSEKTGA